jgi:hypothetical protein
VELTARLAISTVIPKSLVVDVWSMTMGNLNIAVSAKEKNALNQMDTHIAMSVKSFPAS